MKLLETLTTFCYTKKIIKEDLSLQVARITKFGKTKIHEKDESTRWSEVSEDEIYELLAKKLRIILTERLRNLSELTKNKASAEMRMNINDDEIGRNEASLHYDVGNKRKTKILAKSSNETGTSLELSSDITLLEERKVHGNKPTSE